MTHILQFIRELRRRRVFRAVGIYLVGAWAVLQVSDVVLPPIGLNWLLEPLINLVVIGFPVAVILGWRYELSSAGLVRTKPLSTEEKASLDLSLKGVDYVVMAGLAVVTTALAYGVISRVAAPPAGSELSQTILARPKPLTTMEGFEMHPALSPDGSYLAFVWQESEVGTSGDIYVMPVSGGTPTQLTNTDELETMPTWSPDGTRIAFVRSPYNEERYEIIVQSAMGGPESRVARVHHVKGESELSLSSLIDWSADGKILAYSGGDEPENARSIYFLSMDTGEKQRFTDPGPGTFDTNPVFSSDGQLLVFFRRDIFTGGDGRICLQDVDATDANCVMPLDLYFDADWLPNAESFIYVTGGHSGDRMMMRLSVAGGQPVQLVADSGIEHLSIANHADVLVYSNKFHDHNLWRIPGPTSSNEVTPKRLAASTRDELMPSYSADGTKIAFISDRSGNWELWMANADGSDARKLTEMGHAIFPRWSPNDQRLLFSSIPQPGTVSSAFLLDSTGGFPINLLEDDYANGIDNAIPSWSEDTDWFYYQTQREDCGWQLWKRRLEGGDAMHLSSCVLHPLEGPDGRVYFFLVGKGVASVSMGGGETRLELPMSSANAWSAWTIWRQKLVYFDFTDFATKMLDLDTRETQGLYPANSEKRRALYGSLAVSPDGEWIIEARLDRSGSDLLLLNLLE